MQKIAAKKVLRVVDANFNRAKEALRVCEDMSRFFLNKKRLTQEYKAARHKLTALVAALDIMTVIDARDVRRDVGKTSSRSELQRKNASDIFYANSQRAKESIRVLEEFSKLVDGGLAQGLKKIRYQVYALEREIVKRF